ncbi:MAG TPA: bile acid:sodium symporter [Candidatus Sphingobacterium stercoripullorum]|uniref:Bile acid:sodium symporter n=1 Tax=Candidatus Sphingobacterium stercoripullorum TaxID=2838759 RepID=A0A9D1W836_9SPHI|nr:bile acid:sodium symporter [Candidatus Sphingobacterium stercoripullorum]
MKIKFDPFLIALIGAVILASVFPQPYAWDGGEMLNTTSVVGVSLVFFLYGLKLKKDEVKQGLSKWRLHLQVQLATFLLFPLLVLIFYPFVNTDQQFHFWLSFFFLAVLPSTVSSSVVLVSIARGNIPASIFNASISGLIAIVITPLWLSFFVKAQGDLDTLVIYRSLLLEIVVPMFAGFYLQRFWGGWARRNSKKLSNFDKAVVILIVYVSFADSFVSGIFNEIGWMYLSLLLLACVLLFVFIYVILLLLSRYVFRLNYEDEITLLFCGSKKSLMHGSVFGKLLFAGNPYAGLYYLPLLVFHAMQIFIVSVIASRIGGNTLNRKLPVHK